MVDVEQGNAGPSEFRFELDLGIEWGLKDHYVITVGPVRPVFSWSWEILKAMSTKGANMT